MLGSRVALLLVCSIQLVGAIYIYNYLEDQKRAEGLLELDEYLRKTLPDNDDIAQNLEIVRKRLNSYILPKDLLTEALKNFIYLAESRVCSKEALSAISLYRLVARQYVRWRINFMGKSTKEVRSAPRLLHILRQNLKRLLPICVAKMQTSVLEMKTKAEDSGFKVLFKELTKDSRKTLKGSACPWDASKCSFDRTDFESIVSKFSRNDPMKIYDREDKSIDQKTARKRFDNFHEMFVKHLGRPCKKFLKQYGYLLDELNRFLVLKIKKIDQKYADILVGDARFSDEFKEILYVNRFCSAAMSLGCDRIFVVHIEGGAEILYSQYEEDDDDIFD